MTDTRLITGSAIGLTFHGRPVLSDVAVEVRAGEIVTVIGPNGAGKSSLVRVLLGLLRPDAGTVWRRPGLTIGYVPQRLAIDPVLPLTVRRFLALGTRTTAERLHRVLAEVGADRVADSPVQAVSGGELQRIVLARALLRDPDLLILDEPVQGVDVGGQSELYSLINRVRDERGCGILMVSHDLHLVMAAADRVVCLNHRVCCSGHPAHVSDDPEYRQLFPYAPQGLAPYTHDHHPTIRCQITQVRRDG
jgi:zinc transport system ATP-binding protein